MGHRHTYTQKERDPDTKLVLMQRHGACVNVFLSLSHTHTHTHTHECSGAVLSSLVRVVVFPLRSHFQKQRSCPHQPVVLVSVELQVIEDNKEYSPLQPQTHENSAVTETDGGQQHHLLTAITPAVRPSKTCFTSFDKLLTKTTGVIHCLWHYHNRRTIIF